MKLKEGFELRQVGDENIVIATGINQVDFSNIISLNPSAARLWKAVKDKTFTAEELGALLCEWYEVDAATAAQDAQSLVERWQKAGLTE